MLHEYLDCSLSKQNVYIKNEIFIFIYIYLYEIYEITISVAIRNGNTRYDCKKKHIKQLNCLLIRYENDWVEKTCSCPLVAFHVRHRRCLGSDCMQLDSFVWVTRARERCLATMEWEKRTMNAPATVRRLQTCAQFYLDEEQNTRFNVVMLLLIRTGSKW